MYVSGTTMLSSDNVVTTINGLDVRPSSEINQQWSSRSSAHPGPDSAHNAEDKFEKVTASAVDPLIKSQPSPLPRFHLKKALLQSFEYLMVQHAFRIADDPSLRYSLAHSPFFHDWFASYKGYNLQRWSDGDDFLVNDVGHPLQGAVASRIYLQNSPTADTVAIGKSRRYWITRLKGMAWSAAFEVQWKVGPLSETSIGNAGGWSYVPGCGFSRTCLNNPKYPNAPTNNTGLSDWIVTPIVGTGWVVLEDALDKYVAAKVAAKHRILGNMILRTALEPSRSFAGLFMGKFPWQAPKEELHLVKPEGKQNGHAEEAEETGKIRRRSVGVHYVNISLPGFRNDCGGCRESSRGVGIAYSFKITPSLFFDNEINYFPVHERKGRPSLEGLFGAKIGHQGKKWGVFGKVRPGFVYYDEAWTGGSAAQFGSLSRFALDSGGIVEVYPSRRSTLRFDLGTTLIRYLQQYPNPRLSALGTFQSPQYYVNQGNFQISSGYSIRF